MSFASEEEMNHCAIQQGNALSACDDMRTCSRDSVVCPKPRRFGLLNVNQNDPVRSLRWHLGHQAELYDSVEQKLYTIYSKAGSEILDNILSRGSFGVEQLSCTEIASPHPFFSGSPPSRVANPLIQDARFADEKLTPLSPLSPTAPPMGLSSSPSSSARKGGYARASFGSKPAVRIEGFDCLDRDRRNCSIPTLA